MGAWREYRLNSIVVQARKNGDKPYIVQTPIGDVICEHGDWEVRTEQGSKVCKPHVFERDHRLIEDD
jgi:hypothetical protein